MPQTTKERRDTRREQIIDAARARVPEHGLGAVPMEMIIARSGLSTGAVYRYFTGKDQIISAAMADRIAGLARALAPVLATPNPPDCRSSRSQLISTVLACGLRDSGIDLLQVAIHGRGYVQTDPALKAAAPAAPGGMHDQCAAAVKKQQAAGTVSPRGRPARDHAAHHADLPRPRRPARPGRQRRPGSARRRAGRPVENRTVGDTISRGAPDQAGAARRSS